MADRYLLESGAPDGYLLEDSSGVLLLEGVEAAPDLSWAPVYPERVLPKAGLSAAILAGACFLLNPGWMPGPVHASGANDTGQLLGGRTVQYQSQVAPFQAALTPPQEVPTIDGWGQPPSIPVRLVPRAQPTVPIEPPFSVQPLGHVGWQGWYPDRIDRLLGRPDTSFLAEEPFPRPNAEVTTYFTPVYPDQIARLLTRPPDGLFEPPESVRPLGHVGWQGSYADRVDRRTYPAAQQQASFTPTYLPLADLRWAGEFPSQIYRWQVRAADQGFLFAPRYLPIADLRWAPAYPDQIWRQTVRASDQAAFFQPRFVPIFDLRWQGTFPVWIARNVFSVALQQSTAFWPEPLPNEAAPLLSWHPIYPSWNARAILPAALYPFVGPQNLDPLPNEGGVGQQIITLGVEIGVTDVPVLGGWVPF